MRVAAGPLVVHGERRPVTGHVGLAAQFAVDARWLAAVADALHVIQSAGVAPDTGLLADVLTDARHAVGRVVAAESMLGTALAGVALDFLRAVEGCAPGLGADDTRASAGLAAEIVSLAARQAFSGRTPERSRGFSS